MSRQPVVDAGTVLDLVLDDEGDSLDGAERAGPRTALRASHDEASRGELRPVGEVLRKLRARR